jgi:hypothetical protein
MPTSGNPAAFLLNDPQSQDCFRAGTRIGKTATDGPIGVLRQDPAFKDVTNKIQRSCLG